MKLAERSAVTLTDPSFRLGYSLDVTLSFAHADDILLRVLIYPPEGPFEDIRVPPAPQQTRSLTRVQWEVFAQYSPAILR